MGIVHADSSNFELVSSEGIAVVDFWATWCGPCRAYAPVFEASSEKHADVAHIKVDVDEQPAIAATYGVQSIPTTAVLREGVVVGQFAGALSSARLDDLIAQTRALDMDQVRASLSGN